MKKYLLSFGIVGSILFMGAGCGAPAQENTTLNLGNGNSVTVSENSHALPADFPKDIPLYPGSEVSQSAVSQMTTVNNTDCKEGQKQNTKVATMMIKDKGVGSEAKKFYTDALSKSGWKIDAQSEMDMEMGGMKEAGFSAQKDDLKMTMVATEGKSEDKTTPQTIIMLYVQQCVK